MKEYLSLACVAGFLALLPVLLAWRLLRRRHMPWWLLLLLVAALGWLLVNGTVRFHYAHLDNLLASYGDDPPDELLEEWANDGVKMVFALFFGWVYGLVYLVPWFTLYVAIRVVTRFGPRRRPDPVAGGTPS